MSELIVAADLPSHWTMVSPASVTGPATNLAAASGATAAPETTTVPATHVWTTGQRWTRRRTGREPGGRTGGAGRSFRCRMVLGRLSVIRIVINFVAANGDFVVGTTSIVAVLSVSITVTKNRSIMLMK